MSFTDIGKKGEVFNLDRRFDLYEDRNTKRDEE